MRLIFFSSVILGFLLSSCSGPKNNDEAVILAEDLETIVEQSEADKAFSSKLNVKNATLSPEERDALAQLDRFRLALKKFNESKQME